MNILLGVTGSVAVYKSLALVRLLSKAQYSVKVVMSQGAQQFVTPLSFRSLGAEGVYENLWQADEGMAHIELSRWANFILVAPATANIIGKMTHGLADDLLSNCLLAARVPIAISPAMNVAMYQHPATQRNLQQLEQDRVEIWGPATGDQACGEHGSGRMLEAQTLFDNILALPL